MTEEERLQWAKDAEKNPALWESFDVLRKTYMKMASECSIKDDLGRYRYMEAYKDIDVVERHLKAVLHNGRLTPDESNVFKKKKRLIPTF